MQAIYDAFVRRRRRRGSTTPERIDDDRAGARVDGRQAKADRPRRRARGVGSRASTLAKERAKIAADAEVELVIYPPRRSVLELLSEPFGDGRSCARGGCFGSREARALGGSRRRRCACSAAASRWR